MTDVWREELISAVLREWYETHPTPAIEPPEGWPTVDLERLAAESVAAVLPLIEEHERAAIISHDRS